VLDYRFRIYPTKSQERLLAETLETCRHLYNDFLSRRIETGVLVRELQDSILRKLRLLAVYKAERRGGRVMLVNPSGTSQKCSGCGELVLKDLATRKHTCPRCGLVIDRDENAARNILKLGLEQAHVEVKPLFVQRRG